MNEPEPQKDITPIVKAVGVNNSEKLLTRLCDKVFLKLWTYSNTQKKLGKELCDVLVVFENHVFIFSDKSNSFTKAETIEISWNRWKNKAIDKSIKQIKKAEKWIINNPDKIFLDNKCTDPLPFTINKENLKIHRIIVAHGAKEACKNDSPNNINGSLAICYADLKKSMKPAYSPRPFHLIMPRDEVIHVFDSHNLEIILGELNTVQDLLWYFEEKERAIKKYNILQHCGEEDLLAHYLFNFDEKTQKHYIGSINEELNFVGLEEGIWENFIRNDSYKIREEENKVSDFWDKLLQDISQKALDKKLMGADVFNNQSALIEMAKEPRVVRRIFSKVIKSAVENYSANINRKLRTRYYSLEGSDRGYVFIQTPPYLNEDYEKDYRPRRRAMLEIACGIIRNKYSHLKKVIGIAIEPPRLNQGGSQDFALLNCEKWTKKDAEFYLKESKKMEFNFFENCELRMIKGTDYEFPPAPNHAVKTPVKTKPQRNDPCPCGSGKKYKRCCYLKGF